MKKIKCCVIDEHGERTQFESLDDTDTILRHAKSILFDNDWDSQSQWGVECEMDGVWLSLQEYLIRSSMR